MMETVLTQEQSRRWEKMNAGDKTRETKTTTTTATKQAPFSHHVCRVQQSTQSIVNAFAGVSGLYISAERVICIEELAVNFRRETDVN
jgi:hypothetical protein